MKKASAIEAVIGAVEDGASIMVGGFLGVGTPGRLIDELVRQGKQQLTLIANDTAKPGIGVGRLIDAGLVARVITSHIGTNPVTQRLMLEGRLEVTLVPQGTLAERIRAGGFGLGGILTPTGVGTVVAQGKTVVELDGRSYLLETALKADHALIKAKRADYHGNLEYSLTARNFNPLMAMAGGVSIAEADSIVPVGAIPPDMVVTPGVLIKHLVSSVA